MEPINVVTILLSIVGVVAVVEIAMWIFVVIWRPHEFKLDLEPMELSGPQATDHSDRSLKKGSI
jgi:hypothetical protein